MTARVTNPSMTSQNRFRSFKQVQLRGGSGGTGGGGAANTSATANTGGGGGGGSNPQVAGAGGSGVVIIRYPDTFDAASATTGSPTITVTGGYRIYQWTTNGSVTWAGSALPKTPTVEYLVVAGGGGGASGGGGAGGMLTGSAFAVAANTAITVQFLH